MKTSNMQFDNINLDSDFHMGLSIAYSIYMFLKIFWWNTHTSYQKLMLLIQWKYNCYVFVHLDCTFIYLIHFTHTWKHMDVHGVDIWVHNVYWSTCTKPGKHGGCLIRSRNCLPFENTWVHPLFFVLVESVFLIFFVFCAVLLCVFIFWVPCCDVRYDFRMKTMFSSSLPPVACRRAHVFYHVMLFVFVCVWWSQHILGCVFVFFVSCTPCCQTHWIVHIWLSLLYFLTFI